MTGHFTTLDGCEKWEKINHAIASRVYRVPITVRIPRDENKPFSTPRESAQYRLYEVESFDERLGVVHYKEVYEGKYFC
jgi:hypothetical protein